MVLQVAWSRLVSRHSQAAHSASARRGHPSRARRTAGRCASQDRPGGGDDGKRYVLRDIGSEPVERGAGDAGRARDVQRHRSVRCMRLTGTMLAQAKRRGDLLARTAPSCTPSRSESTRTDQRSARWWSACRPFGLTVSIDAAFRSCAVRGPGRKRPVLRERGNRFRVIRANPAPTYKGWLWLDGYQIGRDGDAVERRQIFLRQAGLRSVKPTKPPRPTNAGPARPRTGTEARRESRT